MNPVEELWTWLRREMHAKDMADLRAGRRVPSKNAYKRRVQQLCATQRAPEVTASIARSWRKTCVAVVNANGAGVQG